MQSDYRPCALQRMLAFEESNYCQHTSVVCREQDSLPGKIDKDSIDIAQHDLYVYCNDVILLLSTVQKTALSKGVQNLSLVWFSSVPLI